MSIRNTVPRLERDMNLRNPEGTGLFIAGGNVDIYPASSDLIVGSAHFALSERRDSNSDDSNLPYYGPDIELTLVREIKAIYRTRVVDVARFIAGLDLNGSQVSYKERCNDLVSTSTGPTKIQFPGFVIIEEGADKRKGTGTRVTSGYMRTRSDHQTEIIRRLFFSE